MGYDGHVRAVGFASRAVEQMQMGFRAVINEHYDAVYSALVNAVGEQPATAKGQEIVAQWIVAAETYAVMQDSLNLVKSGLIEYGHLTGWNGTGEPRTQDPDVVLTRVDNRNIDKDSPGYDYQDLPKTMPWDDDDENGEGTNK